MKVGQGSYNGSRASRLETGYRITHISLRNWMTHISQTGSLGISRKEAALKTMVRIPTDMMPAHPRNGSKLFSSPDLTSPIYIYDYIYPPQIQQVAWLHPNNFTWKPRNGNLQYSKMIFQKPLKIGVRHAQSRGVEANFPILN